MLGDAKAEILRHGSDSMNTLRRLRKIVDEIHYTNRRLSATLHLPKWPTLSETLDQDVTAHIFSFLDDESFCTATQVSRSFRTKLIPRQRKVRLGGFLSFEDFAMKTFDSVVFFSARNCARLEDGCLQVLAADYPNLAHVDFSGCKKVSSDGICRFVHDMGHRLKGLAMDSLRESFLNDFSMNDDVRCIEEAISNAPSLMSLSLTVCCASSHKFSMSGLNGHNSLRELSLCIDGAMNLPEDLPWLESLSLELMDSCHIFYWRQLVNSHYPKLKTLEIMSSVYAFQAMPLHIDLLISILARTSNLESFTIRRLERNSPLDEACDLRIHPDFDSLYHSLPVRQPAFEAGETERLVAFAKSRRIKCVCKLD